jgi:hypothetical protein
MHIWIVNNIGNIVKMPFPMKTVTVNSKEQDQEGNKEERIFPQIGKMPGDMQFITAVTGLHLRIGGLEPLKINPTRLCRINVVLTSKKRMV